MKSRRSASAGFFAGSSVGAGGGGLSSGVELKAATTAGLALLFKLTPEPLPRKACAAAAERFDVPAIFRAESGGTDPGRSFLLV